MSLFTEIKHEGFVIYNYSQRVVNRVKNGGSRFRMDYCIAIPAQNKNVKGITVASGFRSEQDAIDYVNSGEVYKWCKKQA